MGREPGGRGTCVFIQVGNDEFDGRNGMERGLEWEDI